MERVLTDVEFAFLRRITIAMLAFISLSSSVFGIVLVNHNIHVYRNLLLMICSEVSLLQKMFVSVVPMLWLWLAHQLAFPLLLFPICFLKTLSFAGCIYAIVCIFGRAYWLVCLLLLLPEGLSILCMYWFSFRNVPVLNADAGRQVLYCSFAVMLVSLLDWRYLSPLLRL